MKDGWEEGECTLHRWPKSWKICGCTRPFYEFSKRLVASGVQHRKYEDRILIQGKGSYCSKLKKGKLKTKKSLKITSYIIRWTREPSVQSAEQVWSWGNMYLPKHAKWSSQQHLLYLKMNKSSGFHARENPKQQYLNVVTFSDPSFSKKHIYVYDHKAKITHHWTDHTVHEKVCFIIRQKLGLFVLGITHISNLSTICIKLMWVGGWV